MSVWWHRELDQMYIQIDLCMLWCLSVDSASKCIYTNRPAQCLRPHATAPRPKILNKKKQSKTWRFLFKVQFKKITFGAFGLPWDFRVSGSANTCIYIYIYIYIYTNRPMHAIMSVCWQHQRDQMYIYKSTYVCYDVCPLTAWALSSAPSSINNHGIPKDIWRILKICQ